MLRKEIVDFLNTEMPDDWYAISEAEAKIVDDAIDAVTSIEPLTKEEALAVANHLPNDDLAGGGQTLNYSIATAPEWPYQMTELFYVDKFSDPLCDIKNKTFYTGFRDELPQGIIYQFQSEANQRLTLDSKNYTTQLLLLREGITRIDFQAIMSILFWDDPKKLRAELLITIKKVAQQFFRDNEYLQIEIPKNSSQSEFLETTLDIEI